MNEQSNLLRGRRRFSHCRNDPARVHFMEPTVDSRRILRDDVNHKESFQIELSLSCTPPLFLFLSHTLSVPFLPRRSSRASSFPIWSRPFGRCRYRPCLLPRRCHARREISTFPLGLYAPRRTRVLPRRYLIRIRSVSAVLSGHAVPSVIPPFV